MRSSRSTILALALALALAGCGARNTLDVGAGALGDAGAPVPQIAHMAVSCAPNDGPAIQLTVGTPTCQASAGSTPVFIFLITNADLAVLAPGSMLTVVDDINGGTQGSVFSGTTTSPVTGTLDFATLVQGVSATGSYDVTWAGGSQSGTFTADECPGNGPCGG